MTALACRLAKPWRGFLVVCCGCRLGLFRCQHPCFPFVGFPQPCGLVAGPGEKRGALFDGVDVEDLIGRCKGKRIIKSELIIGHFFEGWETRSLTSSFVLYPWLCLFHLCSVLEGEDSNDKKRKKEERKYLKRTLRGCLSRGREKRK